MSADKRSVRIQGSPIDHSWLVVMRCKRTNGKSCENQLRGRDRSTCRICVPNNWTATEKALFRPDLLEGEEKAVVTTQNLEGEVTAFRGWSLKFDGQSYSLVSNYLWNSVYWIPGQPAKAQCHRWFGDDSHEPPHWNCTCGFYAAKEPTGSIGDIIGTVAMWGHYVEHEEGWRAEYAYPKSVTSLKCSECSQVFPWGTMKYLTTSTQEPSKKTELQTTSTREPSKKTEFRRLARLSMSKMQEAQSRRCLFTNGSRVRDLEPDFPKRDLLGSLSESLQKSQRTQKIWRTVLACEECAFGSKLNGEWLPAAHLVERIEHTYGLEVK